MNPIQTEFIAGVPVRRNHIITQIVEQEHAYICKTGHDPDMVYLGHLQWCALQEYMNEFCTVKDERFKGLRPSFHGMEVVRALEDDYVAVGIKPRQK